MEDPGPRWPTHAENPALPSDSPQPPRTKDDTSFQEEQQQRPQTVYKPSLTVDVAAAEGNATHPSATSPQPTKTPHVATNIFVAGLPTQWGDDELREHYKAFGDILSTKVVKSKHFGFVMFRTAEAAHKAINETHLSQPTPTCPTVLHVSIAMHDEGVDEVASNRVFVRGLPQWATKGHLQLCFSAFGTVLGCAVLMNPLGQCKGSGFVQFSSVEEATAAVNAKEKVRMENWDSPLDVKFSETLEVRQQRQERNRNRQRSSANTPKHRGFSAGEGGGGLSPGAAGPLSVGRGGAEGGLMNVNSQPFPFFPPPFSVLPSPQGFPVAFPPPFPPMAYPQPSPQQLSQNLLLPQPTPSLALPTVSTTDGQVLCSPAGLSTPSASERPTHIVYPQRTNLHFFSAGGIVMVEPPPIPLKGDLHFFGKLLNEELLRILLQPFGPIELMKVLDDTEGGGIAVRMQNASQHPTIAQSLNGAIFATGDLLAAGLYA